MYKIRFYKDSRGREPVFDYIKTLKQRKDKDSRIKLNKIQDYIEMLSLRGTNIGEPYVKHLSGDIWDLRPLRDRIFFAAWDGDGFVLLHYFVKKTQKTPVSEIEKAQRELAELRESEDYKNE